MQGDTSISSDLATEKEGKKKERQDKKKGTSSGRRDITREHRSYTAIGSMSVSLMTLVMDTILHSVIKRVCPNSQKLTKTINNQTNELIYIFASFFFVSPSSYFSSLILFLVFWAFDFLKFD